MPGLLDLPPELRIKIFSYAYPPRCACQVHYPVLPDHPAASLVNRELRLESLESFYRHYIWGIVISISKDGNVAYTSSGTVKYLQALQQANELHRIQHFRFHFTFPGVKFFSRVEPHCPFEDEQDPDKVSYYDILHGILCQAPKLRLIEFSQAEHLGKHYKRLCSPAYLRLLRSLPKTCEYRLTLAPNLPLRRRSKTRIRTSAKFAEHLKEATGKTLLVSERAI